MKPEQQRIAIAEACGFKKEIGVTGFVRWRDKEGLRDYLPNYCNNLGAMNEAEETLTDEQLYLYGNILDRVTLPENKKEMAYIHGPEAGMYPELFRATAAQRAEAFLRTVGRWEE
jgi:hypothetical protein